MTILSIDVLGTDSDGNIASGSVDILVNDQAAAPGDVLPAMAFEGAGEREPFLFRSVGGLTNEQPKTQKQTADVIATAVKVAQSVKSQIISRFTGGYR